MPAQTPKRNSRCRASNAILNFPLLPREGEKNSRQNCEIGFFSLPRRLSVGEFPFIDRGVIITVCIYVCIANLTYRARAPRGVQVGQPTGHYSVLICADNRRVPIYLWIYCFFFLVPRSTLTCSRDCRIIFAIPGVLNARPDFSGVAAISFAIFRGLSNGWRFLLCWIFQRDLRAAGWLLCNWSEYAE